MLNRYYVDVSSLETDDIRALKEQFDRFSFETFEKFSDDFLYIIGLDVYLSPSYDFDKLFTLPDNCSVIKLG